MNNIRNNNGSAAATKTVMEPPSPPGSTCGSDGDDGFKATLSSPIGIRITDAYLPMSTEEMIQPGAGPQVVQQPPSPPAQEEEASSGDATSTSDFVDIIEDLGSDDDDFDIVDDFTEDAEKEPETTAVAVDEEDASKDVATTKKPDPVGQVHGIDQPDVVEEDTEAEEEFEEETGAVANEVLEVAEDAAPVAPADAPEDDVATPPPTPPKNDSAPPTPTKHDDFIVITEKEDLQDFTLDDGDDDLLLMLNTTTKTEKQRTTTHNEQPFEYTPQEFIEDVVQDIKNLLREPMAVFQKFVTDTWAETTATHDHIPSNHALYRQYHVAA
eukprot:CAMPEP_0119546012 /NCGR_PEP_ID=MMETSP1352-20130426/598_1 /TAXON_ID=265584 /ORGANISM="Stauroneis constricta, Strain CCMP1120" /LENGTH=325 /DNA_ID=CAMNT_0007590661 /DNA_START=97 /DNA_END=1074 /DNA_ORIENTATION=+